MSDLIVLTFEDAGEAAAVRRAFSDLDSHGGASVIDSAVISRDAAGELHAEEQIASGTKTGALAGGALGLLLGVWFPPVGLALAVGGGAAAGAWLGHDLGGYVDKEFVSEVEAALTPGSSALFLLLGEANTAAVAGALRAHRGRVYQTTLDPEAEDSIKRALGQTT
jgi:uncharacterized membrane protein